MGKLKQGDRESDLKSTLISASQVIASEIMDKGSGPKGKELLGLHPGLQAGVKL